MVKWANFLKLYKSDSMQSLQSLNLQMFAPSEPLADYIQNIWLVHNADNRETLPFKILSDCSASLIFNFSSKLLLERKEHTFNAAHESVIIGPSPDLLTLTFNGPIKAMGIKFLPAGGNLFFKQAMDQLANRFTGAT